LFFFRTSSLTLLFLFFFFFEWFSLLDSKVEKLCEIHARLMTEQAKASQNAERAKAAAERQDKLRLRTAHLLRRLAKTTPASAAEREFISDINHQARTVVPRLHERLEECESIARELVGGQAGSQFGVSQEEAEQAKSVLSAEQSILEENRRVVNELRSRMVQLEI
jgi:hypothetical protein